jgi:hypothetical protein
MSVDAVTPAKRNAYGLFVGELLLVLHALATATGWFVPSTNASRRRGAIG